MTVERGVGLRDDRPRVRVGGRFAGEVSGIELLEGGVDVVEVEHDERRDPLSALISTMRSNSVWNASGRWSRPEQRHGRGRGVPAGRNDGRRDVRDPDIGGGPQVRDFGISTVSDAGVHDRDGDRR